MSVEAMQWAFNQDIKPSSVKFVLVSLGDNAQADGLAWPSIASLCQKTGQDRKTVIAALDKLEAMGFLSDTGKRTGSTGQIKVYSFNFARSNSAENGTVPETEQYRNSAQRVPNFPPNSTVFPHKSTENGTRNHQEPSRNRQGNHQKRGKPAPTDFDPMAHMLAAGVDQQTAGDWMEHRKKKRASASATVLKDREKQAQIAGIPLVDALAMEVSRNWQGFEATWLQPKAAQQRDSPGGPSQLGKAGQATAAAAQRLREKMKGGQHGS